MPAVNLCFGHFTRTGENTPNSSAMIQGNITEGGQPTKQMHFLNELKYCSILNLLFFATQFIFNKTKLKTVYLQTATTHFLQMKWLFQTPHSPAPS